MYSHRRQKSHQKRKIKERSHLKEEGTQQDNQPKVASSFTRIIGIAMFLVIIISVVAILGYIGGAIGQVSYASTEEDSSSNIYSLMNFSDMSEESLSKSRMAYYQAKKAKEIKDYTAFVNLLEEFRANLESEDSALTETYNTLTSQIDEFYKLGEEISPLYDSAKAAVVCSKANKFNNAIQEIYSQMLEILSNVQELYSQYEEEYVALEQEVEGFNTGTYAEELLNGHSYSEFCSNSEDELDLSEELSSSYVIVSPFAKSVSRKVVDALAYEEEIYVIVSDAQQIADDFFNLVFYDMSHIANAEAGSDWLEPEEIYYVLNVVENRVESPKFRQNTTHDVIFAPGQYTPVASGGFYVEPTEQGKERTATYLRGLVDTGMPSNVVFQSRGIQGDGIWQYTPSGHYFCYKNGA